MLTFMRCICSAALEAAFRTITIVDAADADALQHARFCHIALWRARASIAPGRSENFCW